MATDDHERSPPPSAELLPPGDLLLLAGEMGAGKTTFAQGFGAGLGITDRVTSPTFTLVHELRGARVSACATSTCTASST